MYFAEEEWTSERIGWKYQLNNFTSLLSPGKEIRDWKETYVTDLILNFSLLHLSHQL